MSSPNPTRPTRTARRLRQRDNGPAARGRCCWSSSGSRACRHRNRHMVVRPAEAARGQARPRGRRPRQRPRHRATWRGSTPRCRTRSRLPQGGRRVRRGLAARPGLVPGEDQPRDRPAQPRPSNHFDRAMGIFSEMLDKDPATRTPTTAWGSCTSTGANGRGRKLFRRGNKIRTNDPVRMVTAGEVHPDDRRPPRRSTVSRQALKLNPT